MVAGGCESMTNAPFGLPEMRWGAKMGLPSRPAVDLMVHDGLWCAFYNRHMALHGSEVADEFGFRILDARQPVDRIQQELRRQIGSFLQPVEP